MWMSGAHTARAKSRVHLLYSNRLEFVHFYVMSRASDTRGHEKSASGIETRSCGALIPGLWPHAIHRGIEGESL